MSIQEDVISKESKQRSELGAANSLSIYRAVAAFGSSDGGASSSGDAAAGLSFQPDLARNGSHVAAEVLQRSGTGSFCHFAGAVVPLAAACSTDSAGEEAAWVVHDAVVLAVVVVVRQTSSHSTTGLKASLSGVAVAAVDRLDLHQEVAVTWGACSGTD